MLVDHQIWFKEDEFWVYTRCQTQQSAQFWPWPLIWKWGPGSQKELTLGTFPWLVWSLTRLQIEADVWGTVNAPGPGWIHASQIIVGPTIFDQPWRTSSDIPPVKHKAGTVNLLCQLKKNVGWGWGEGRERWFKIFPEKKYSLLSKVTRPPGWFP